MQCLFTRPETALWSVPMVSLERPMELACTQATNLDLHRCRVITTARVMANFSPWVVLRRKAEAANGVVGAPPSGWAATLSTANAVVP